MKTVISGPVITDRAVILDPVIINPVERSCDRGGLGGRAPMSLKAAESGLRPPNVCEPGGLHILMKFD